MGAPVAPSYSSPPYSSAPPQNSYQASALYHAPAPSAGYAAPAPAYASAPVAYQPAPAPGYASRAYAPRKSYRKPYYGNNSTFYDGSVAEVILRGYSLALNDNKNKAVIKLFQDVSDFLNFVSLLSFSLGQHKKESDRLHANAVDKNNLTGLTTESLEHLKSLCRLFC